MFCWKCGQELPDDVEFCGKCGVSQRKNKNTGTSVGTLNLNIRTIREKFNSIAKWVAFAPIVISILIRFIESETDYRINDKIIIGLSEKKVNIISLNGENMIFNTMFWCLIISQLLIMFSQKYRYRDNKKAVIFNILSVIVSFVLINLSF